MAQIPDTPWVGEPNEVGGALNSASDYARGAVSSAQNFISKLSSQLSDIEPPSITPEFPDTPGAPPIATTSVPSLSGVGVSMPTPPSKFVGNLDVSDLLPEPFDEDPPTLRLGDIPTFNGVAPTPPAVDYNLEVPDFEGITFPDAPQLLSINVKPFDGVTIPEFTEEVPELTLTPPTVREYEEGALYASSLLTNLQDTLEDRIVNGGTGLPADVEQGIWDRGREREAIATRDALDELDRMETQGFALPPGAYVDNRLRITTEMHSRTVSLSREIAIEQARLELDNINNALQGANTLEGQLIQYHNQVAQRAFEATRYATEAGVQIYNARVRGYEAFVSAYRVKASVYEAKIRGLLAQVDAYRAEVDAERAKAEVNRSRVEAYEAQIRASLSAVDVYQAEVSAIQAKAEIERLKADIYGAEVRGFAAEANAYSAQVGGYEAQVQGETARVGAYEAQARAYGAKVDGQRSAIEGRISAFRARLDEKLAEWEGYKARSQAAANAAEVTVAQNRALVDAHQVESAATQAYNQTLTSQWQVSLEQAQRTAEIGVSAAKANADLYVSSRSLSLDASKVGAQVTAQLAAAALNAVNYSYGFSESNSYTVSNSASNSTSRSASDITYL